MSKKIKLTKTEKKMVIFLLAIAAILPLLAFNKFIDNEYLKDLVGIGNNIAGMLIPLFTIGSGILVYIAFKAQIKANNQIKKQFKKQSEEQLFFRLVDTLERFIINSTITLPGNRIKEGHNIILYITDELGTNIETSYSNFVLAIIKNDVNVLTDFHKDLLCTIEIPSKFKDIDEFNNAFIDKPEFSNYKLQSLINTLKSENSYSDKVSRDIFKDKFKTVNYPIYNMFYKDASNGLFRTHNLFIDGYCRIIIMILNHCNKTGSSFYIEYLKSYLTIYDKKLILIFVATSKLPYNNHNLLLTSNFFEELYSIKGLKPNLKDIFGDESKNFTHEEYSKHIELLLKKKELDL